MFKLKKICSAFLKNLFLLVFNIFKVVISIRLFVRYVAHELLDQFASSLDWELGNHKSILSLVLRISVEWVHFCKEK